MTDNEIRIAGVRFLLEPPHTNDSVKADIAQWTTREQPWQCKLHHSRETIGSRSIHNGPPYEALTRCRRCHKIEPMG